MLKELIKIADKLDAAGHQKEADELDEVIQKLAQQGGYDTGPIDDIELGGMLRSIKEALYEQVDKAVDEFVAEAYNVPEDWRGSHSEWAWRKLTEEPITIVYPAR